MLYPLNTMSLEAAVLLQRATSMGECSSPFTLTLQMAGVVVSDRSEGKGQTFTTTLLVWPFPLVLAQQPDVPVWTGLI